jgi:glycolate oxidase FAD binding subunit
VSFAPADEQEAAEIVRAAQAPFDIEGGGTRAGFGRPRQGARLSTARLTGIVFHEPAEMTLRARAGTPLAEVEARIAQAGQMLPFEPMDPRPLFGTAGEPTVGGLVATALAGPRRISAGAVRDNTLGVRLVNGLGEITSAGGRVMKNVTGLDLVKIACGAHGTLGLITEATFKLLPKPRAEATVVIRRLDDARAAAAMARALGSPYGVSGAATIHAGMGRDWPRTVLRVEGFEDSVAYRAERLIALLADFGAKHALTGEDSARMWRDIRDAAYLADPRERAVWRASLKPSDAPAALAALGETARASQLDHGGGLVWFSTDPTPEAAARVRSALENFAGHVHLIRADAALRERAAIFPPLGGALDRMTRGVKASLDPKTLFNPGRMYADI